MGGSRSQWEGVYAHKAETEVIGTSRTLCGLWN